MSIPKSHSFGEAFLLYILFAYSKIEKPITTNYPINNFWILEDTTSIST
jgi:hypothetical protein